MCQNNLNVVKSEKSKGNKRCDSNGEKCSNFKIQLYNTYRLSVSRCEYKTGGIKDGVNINGT